MRLYDRIYTKDQVLKQVGHISQIAGIKSYTLNDGMSQGLDAFDVKTGSGLIFTVLKDRALDIAWMEYRGYPIGFINKDGITHPMYYRHQDCQGFLPFTSGVLTTCGLTYVGSPDKKQSFDVGLQDTISNIAAPAYEVSYSHIWDEDELILNIEGKIQDSVLFHENLTMYRNITTKVGENKLYITDEIKNEGYDTVPLMLLYHMNIGFPIVSPDSKLIAPILWTNPRNEEAQKGIERMERFEEPTPNYNEQVFFHKIAADGEGNTYVGIINERLNIGFYIYYNVDELPCLTQWKMMDEQDYVVGIEPGNCYPIEYPVAKDRGNFQMLSPGEIKEIHLELGILTTWEEIQCFKDSTLKLKKNVE